MRQSKERSVWSAYLGGSGGSKFRNFKRVHMERAEQERKGCGVRRKTLLWLRTDCVRVGCRRGWGGVQYE